MSDKRYRVTTKSKTFELDWLNNDTLKEENNIFYARETKANQWSRITVLEKRTKILDWFEENFILPFIIGITMWFAGFWLIEIIDETFQVQALVAFAFLFWVVFGIYVVAGIFIGIGKLLNKLPAYYTTQSDNQIRKIIRDNKPISYSSAHVTNSGGHSNYSYGSGNRSSGSGGGSSGGTGGYTGTSYTKPSTPYVSSEMLDKALKELNDNGLTWDVLANDKTESEKENLFADQLGSVELGRLANEKFNRDSIWPSRKSTLKKLIDNGEYYDDADKESLNEQLNDIGTEITQDKFQEFARNIRKFHEKKRRKDNHIKYEGRLSNKDIQAIKEYHGYVCMACGLNPIKEYGANMKGIMEAHHKNPYAEIEDGDTRTVVPNDFLILCPNCHRLIHKLDSPDDLHGLKQLVNKKGDS